MVNFEVNEEIRKFKCNHVYHVDCIDNWLSKEKVCPLCKKDVI